MLTPEEIEEILEEFDPLRNADDKKLVNYLGGRRIPEDELIYLYA